MKPAQTPRQQLNSCSGKYRPRGEAKWKNVKFG